MLSFSISLSLLFPFSLYLLFSFFSPISYYLYLFHSLSLSLHLFLHPSLSLCSSPHPQELELLEALLRCKADALEGWDARSVSSLRSALSRQDRGSGSGRMQLWDELCPPEEEPGRINALQLRLDESQKVLLKERE